LQLDPKNVTIIFDCLIAEVGFARCSSVVFEQLQWLFFYKKKLSTIVPRGRARWSILWPH
jgi:hypothetical protein